MSTDRASELANKLTNAIRRYVTSTNPRSPLSPADTLPDLHGTLQEIFVELGVSDKPTEEKTDVPL